MLLKLRAWVHECRPRNEAIQLHILSGSWPVLSGGQPGKLSQAKEENSRMNDFANHVIDDAWPLGILPPEIHALIWRLFIPAERAPPLDLSTYLAEWQRLHL
jgi:hypothetical protein